MNTVLEHLAWSFAYDVVRRRELRRIPSYRAEWTAHLGALQLYRFLVKGLSFGQTKHFGLLVRRYLQEMKNDR